MTVEVPTARELGLPAGTVIAIPAGGLTLYRLIRGSAPDRDDFRPLRAERARARRVPELLRLGLSHFLSVEHARAVMRRPSSRVAALLVEHDMAAHVARTGRLPGHVTVWASTEDLLARARVVASP